MLTFLIDGLICVGFALLAGFIGAIMGYTRGVTETNIKNLIGADEQPVESLYCLCTHGKQAHKRGHKECGVFLGMDKATGGRFTCACEVFVPDPTKANRS